MIKTLGKLSILLALGAFAATGTSNVCWSGGNGCGDTPTCAFGQPGANAVLSNCVHGYCDSDYACPWNSNTRDFRQSSRALYTWRVGTTQYQCTGTTAVYSDTGGCCSCAVPGAIQYPPPGN